MTIFHLPWWNRQPEVKKTCADYLQQFHDSLSDEIKRTPPPPPPPVYIHSDHVVPRVIADKLEQIAKEMKIMTDQLDELTRLQSLLATPNLSQANIDEINQQIGALLMQKRGEKKGEVWLDER